MAKINNNIVKKSNAIIRGHWQIESIWEPRLVALMASKIRVDDEDFKTYTLKISEVLGSRYSGKTLKELESAIKNALGHLITVHNSPTKRSYYHIFSKCSIDTKAGTLEVRFDADLKPHFLNLQERFTKINLLEFMSLPSVYSQRLYEILMSWCSSREVSIPIESLHEMLDTPESYKHDFRQFRLRILEQAHKDIVEREKTSLWYDYEPIKSGRAGKIVAVRFVFDKRAILEKDKPTRAEEEIFILQRNSNRCYEKAAQKEGPGKCIPKPKTKQCQYCLERGRMKAWEIIRSTQENAQTE